MNNMGEINGSRVRSIYRATHYSRKNQERVYVTVDGKIWLGYGGTPEWFSHVGNVGDRGSAGYRRDEILRAANS
jgi:hypothetical protein